jgi:hypothetical protein
MRITLVCLLTFFSLTVFGQVYKINFTVKGLKDTTAYLGYYYGESTFIKDTARVNSNGEFVFDGKKELPHGIYFLVLNKSKLFDFVVSNTQKFGLETATDDYVKKMVVRGDPDNKLFFENMMFNVERHKEAEPLIKILQDSTLKDEAKKQQARKDFDKINEKVNAYQDELIAKHPTTMTAKLLKATKQVKVPEPPRLANGRIDSTFQLKWYRQHFFDNFDLADDALIRLPRPIYQEKITEYLDKLYLPNADSIQKGIDFIVSRSQKNQETFKYSVWMCVVKYQTPEIMGLDEVYVNLYDKYFANGQMDFWVNANLKKNLKEQADRFKRSLVGRKGANLIMLDQNLQKKSMYDIKNKYTILFIFDPDCGHCKEETPKLVNFYNTNRKKYDYEVYAVSADSSMTKMKNYITDMKMPWITVNGPRSFVGSYQDLYDANTTPTLYILDDKKKIIAKKLPVEKIEDFLSHYEKRMKDVKINKM